ncbi:MAG: hypothetical protein CMJ89_01785 [Planctomycetes bacterium]|nr:hypothetical protein [Planctomycetota bacterium]
MGREKWNQARDALVRLVSEHQGAPYVLQERSAILDDLKKCTFCASYDAPEPDELIDGELLSWNEKSGKIKLRYRPGRMGDFIKPARKKGAQETLVHPLTFAGSYSATIKLQRYLVNKYLPVVHVGWNTNAPVTATFGLKRGGRGNTVYFADAAISFHENGSVQKTVKKKSTLESGAPATLKINVKSGSISVYGNGRKLASGSRKKGIFGQIAFNGFTYIEEIEIQGTAQGSWLQGLRDAAFQAAWELFEKDYEPKDLLPEWFLGKGIAAEASTTDQPPYPGPHRPEQDDLFGEVMRRSKDANYDALKWFLDTDQGETTEEFRCFVRAYLMLRGQNYKGALKLCERACRIDPEHVASRLLLAELHELNGSRETAIQELESLWRLFPEDGRIASRLAETLLSASRVSDARNILKEAVANGIHPRQLENVDGVLTKIERGPDWPNQFESVSKHYRVVSDIDRKICFEAANHLEKSLNRFNRDLRRVSGAQGRRYRAYLFSGREGYLAFCEDFSGYKPEFSAGIYSFRTKQLLIWNAPDRGRMFNVIRHEGFHQYFDRLVGQSPRWLNEGLAEYYEDIKLVDGSWKQGQPRSDHLAVLARSNPYPLKRFVEISDADFFKDIALSYAQSWAVVHFLRHHGRYKDRFEKLIDLLMTDAAVEDAVNRAFEDVDYKAMDADFRAHLVNM